MTPEQRERMEFYASRPKTQLAIAVRAALAEIDALRKALEELGAPVEADAMCGNLVKCGTFTMEAQKQRDFVSVEKSLFDALRKDRERLDKLEDPRRRRLVIVQYADAVVAIFDDYAGGKLGQGATVREAIDAIPETPCRS